MSSVSNKNPRPRSAPAQYIHAHLSAPELHNLLEPLLLLTKSSTSTINANTGGNVGSIGIRGRHFNYDSDDGSTSDADAASSDNDDGEDNQQQNASSSTSMTLSAGIAVDDGAAVPGLMLPIIIPVNDDDGSGTSSTIGGDDGVQQQQQHVNVNKQYKCINLPTAILSSTESAALIENTTSSSSNIAQFYLDIGKAIKTQPVVVLLLRSGRFAGGVFVNQKCVEHRVCTRYTVRKGQGGSQSARDNAKGKAKSMGAQLRRAGETALREDVKQTLESWERWMQDAMIVFLSCPNTMKKALHEDCSKVLPKGDARLRRIPLSFKRPTYEAVCFVHKALTFATIRTMMDGEVQALLAATSATQAKQDSIKAKKISTSNASTSHATNGEDPTLLAAQNDDVEVTSTPDITPFTPLHDAAAAANLNALMEAMERHEMSIDVRAGEKEMTPLHLASSSKGEDSAKCVKALLVAGHANPCVVDFHGRPPFYLAATDKIKEAFRTARAELGEDFCAWTENAKVGPALTKEMIQAKKEKEAQKKRRQRARQKEKKLEQKKAAEEEETRRREEEELKKKEEEAKRVRAGLAAKKASNACDFCQKLCRRTQMFSRLEFSYCSTDCVKRHQRELMATAASRRLNTGI
eukprot:CAMPEP_0196808832 /NCGR_PEP_ID=MMETSP1362-20130617/8828_1 /TAXON_ID=163516 /ORGANISM="Leptocylindrus danicus, Strain CCMP1856" /LENGTH=634 /DNA_ID=CAMNT_0042183319 /DNA_START=127 /DNA_END=2031 /DNA_ORIENTATION=+